jgi:hypothetical protein
MPMLPLTSVLASLILAGAPLAPRTVGTGAWSAPVLDSRGQGIQARTLVVQGRILGDPRIRETCVYVEIRNASEAIGDALQIYVDPDIRWSVRNAKGDPVPQTPGGGSGAVPGPGWFPLPHDATLRLRVNPYGYGRAGGLLLSFLGSSWMVPAGAREDYFLSGTLKLDPEDASDRRPAWRGTVMLPPVRLRLPADRL